MKKSLTIRVISGVLVASTLLVVPATAMAAVRELNRPTDAAAAAENGGSAAAVENSASAAAAENGGSAAARAEDAGYGGGTARPPAESDAGKVKPRVVGNLPFRLGVPGVAASGVYTGNLQVAVTLKVTGRAPCGILQLTRNGPADGIEWHTVGALCSPGTATFRTQVNRLWGSRALPSIRLCNGDSLGLAEGVDCDKFTPPSGA
ncbi:hypothetical protein [Actinoplanes sp. NPDC026670]|uniref:hypothetical protein n=1 Tax=Actinoplanes sp. NPDC026670 TaxID=3154700 RepID=UPI0033EB65CB